MAAVEGELVSTDTEHVAAGVQVALGPGDSTVVPSETAGAICNQCDAPAAPDSP